MASSLALKRLISSNVGSSRLLLRGLIPVRPAARPLSSRLFNTNAACLYDSDECDLDVDRRSSRRVFSPFAAFDPFSSRSLSQILNIMDQLDSPVAYGAICRNWVARVKDDGLHLRVDMPGLEKKDVKVTMEQNTLIIKGEGEKDSKDYKSGRVYTSRISIPEKLYKTSEIKAEMKNGVLKVFIPKIKEEERTDVFNVKVE